MHKAEGKLKLSQTTKEKLTPKSKFVKENPTSTLCLLVGIF